MARRPSDILRLDVVPSTNDVALERGRSGAPHGFAVLARRQTSGRGRRGHVWASPEGNLYLSVVLRPRVDAARLPGIALACGLGSLEGLDCLCSSNETQVKWPNDLVVHGRKLGGMVIECTHAKDGPFAVCGIGINVAASPALAPTPASGAAALPPVSLADLLERPPALDEVAHATLDGIVRRVDAWAGALEGAGASAGTALPLLEDYQARLYLLGHEVEALSPAGEALARGTFRAIDAWGRAVIDPREGDPRPFSPEQASLRPLPRP